MANEFIILLCITIAASTAFPTTKEAELVTEPKPGDEFVFVQSSGSDARPISRKDKVTEQERPFETSHKVPASLTFARKEGGEEEKPVKPTKNGKKVQKREANPQGSAPAPAGAIKLDVKALLKKYETELKTSTTPKPKVTSTTTKSGRRRGAKRVKKEARQEAFQVTSPSPVLTTAKAEPKKIDDDDDVPLLGAASEKQRSRIQIKKGPNGQEYEYEYVYYYYDDEEDPKDKKVTNAHDGPARNQITRGDKSREKATPEANEVVPSRGSKTRGRQLGEEETVSEERLPANTRFPPRSRNLNTTPVPEEETTKAVTRARGRGRPTTEPAPNSSSETDSVSDETQGGTRGRTRANVRRPSLDLVDSDSFNTYSGKPAFPQELPEGPVRFLGATPNERVELEPEDESEATEEKFKSRKEDSEDEKDEEDSTSSLADDSTTAMSPMDKVALDLYAISQGTQKLFGEGEDAENSTDVEKTASTEDSDGITEPITETAEPETTTVTTTTTTTTTTPAPTTTTTTTTTTEAAAPFGRGKFGGRRNGIGGRKTTSQSTTTTEAAQTETKPKGKFGRPSFGNRARPGKTTAAPAVEEEVRKEEAKPASHSRPTLSRGRFGGASRPRGRTTAATEEPKEESSNGSSSSTSSPSLRPSLPRARPSFNLRTRGRTTAAPSTEEDQPKEESSPSTTEASGSTTAKGRRIGAPGVRPLRPGPRINLSARGRPGAATTTTTTEAPVEDQVAEAEEEQETTDQEASEKEETPAAPVDNSPLGRLRNKNRVNVQHRPKAAASAPVQVRRVNPLIARRRPGQTTEAPSSEAPQEALSTEETETAEEEITEAAPSSSTTEEPKGLNKLLAGRRRPGVRTPGTLAHRT